MSKKAQMQVSEMSSIENEKLEELFENSFRDNLEKHTNMKVDEFDCSVEKDFVNHKTKMKVTIYGLAGTTSRKEYHDKKSGEIISGGKIITVARDGKNIGKFKFETSCDLNTNDYIVYYEES